MSDVEFIFLFLKEKCQGIPFQVWGYDYAQDEVRIIYASKNKTEVPPVFQGTNYRGGKTYEVVAEAGKIAIFYHYPSGNQISVQIFHPISVLSKQEIMYLYHFFYKTQTEEEVRMKDMELNNLVDSIQAISSSLDLEEVLSQIIRNALKVIPATDAGYLLLYDPDSDRLVPKAPVGFNDNIYNFKVKVGESITGKVFEDGKGRIFNSTEKILKEMKYYNVSADNHYHITSATKTTEAAICVPASIEGVRIGVMMVHQWRRKKIMTKRDLKLLEGFAGQAAIAIQNAQYYSEAQEKIAVITELSEELKEKNSQLEKRHFVHESLTSISLENKGLDAIMYEFNQMIERPVSFYNALENKFHLHEPDQVPDLTMHELRALFSGDRQPIQMEDMYVYPIYNDIIFLGCIIIHVKDEISELDRMTLEQGEPILVLELMKQQSVTEYFYRKTHEQFQALLDQPDDAHVLKVGTEMGLTTSSYWFIAIVEIPNYIDLQLLEINIHQLTSKIKKGNLSTEEIIYGYNNQVILLISISDPSDFTAVQKKLQSIKEDWEQNNQLHFMVGISTPYQGLENIRKCYEEATKTLTYLASRNRTKIMCYDEIGLNKLFINQSPTEIKQFISDVFYPLWVDDDRFKDLEETLLIYIETNRSASQTAKKLHIHINTLYQRIKKIEDLLELKLNDPEDVLKVQLACHLRSSYTNMQV